MNSLKKPAFFTLLFLITFGIWAQEAADKPETGPSEPESTEIVLPMMYLEIEDLTVEDINAVIPDDDTVYLAAIEMPLPEPEDIVIPAEAFALTGTELPEAAAAESADGSSFFSEGTIGFGTSYNITGDINLYRIGDSPDFRLRYYHNGYDGFAGHSPGEGFSCRQEQIEGELDFAAGTLTSGVRAEYNEVENGLQGRAAYSSMTHRISKLEGDLEWSMTDGIELESDLAASVSTLVLNAASPLESSVFSVEPSAGIWFGTDALKAGIELAYGLEGALPSAAQAALSSAFQLLGAELGLVAAPADEFGMELSAGVLWENYTEWCFPFSLTFSGSAGGTLDYSVSGGYRAEHPYYKDLWAEYPFASAPLSASVLPALPLTRTWFGEGSLSWNIVDNLAVNTSAEFGVLTGDVAPGTSSLTGLGALDVYDCMRLSLGAEVFFRLSESFSMTAGWKGQLLQQIDLFSPRHSFYADVEVNSEDRNVGLIANSELRIYDNSQSWFVNDYLPEVGAEAYLRFSDGLLFSLLAEDLVSGFSVSGRNSWNGYLSRGASVTTKIKISL